MAILFNGIGLLGVALIVAAFFLLENETLKSTSKRYLLLNLIGSLMIIFSLLWDWNLASFIINAAWSIISIYGMIKHRHA